LADGVGSFAKEKEDRLSDFVGLPNPNPTGLPMLPAEGLVFPPPNPPNPPNLGGEPKGEPAEGALEDDPNGLDAGGAPKRPDADPEPEEDGAVKLKEEEEDPKTFVVGSGGLSVLSLELEEDAAGGNENADLLAGGKENGEEEDVVASNFGVNPPPNGVEEEEEEDVSFSLNPVKEAGGVGIEKEDVLAVDMEEELDFLLDFSSYSFCTLPRCVLYLSNREAISAKGSFSTDFEMAARMEALSPRRDLKYSTAASPSDSTSGRVG
jgi:hypothetical protein